MRRHLSIFGRGMSCGLWKCLASQELTSIDSIRFAQDTSGNSRWQPPRAPLVNRSTVIQVDAYGSQCPQTPAGQYSFAPANNSASSEDCLFINVSKDSILVIFD